MIDFYYDVAAGTLPTYAFVEPRWFKFFDWEPSDQVAIREKDVG